MGYSFIIAYVIKSGEWIFLVVGYSWPCYGFQLALCFSSSSQKSVCFGAMEII